MFLWTTPSAEFGDRGLARGNRLALHRRGGLDRFTEPRINLGGHCDMPGQLLAPAIGDRAVALGLELQDSGFGSLDSPPCPGDRVI